MKLPEDLLCRTPEEATRRIALALLQEVRTAGDSLGAPDRAEALHDFRVALRKLRSTLKIWRDHLGSSVKGKDRRGLRRLQKSTGGARDAEVALLWLTQQETLLDAPARKGLERAARPLRKSQRQAGGGWSEMQKAVRRRERVLGARLRAVPLAEEPQPWRGFAEILADKAHAMTQCLAAALRGITAADDPAPAHQARIAGKELRYLLEPLRQHLPAAEPLILRCKELQDLLGEFHDAHVLLDHLGSLRANDAEESAGIVELTRRSLDRIQTLYGRIESEWLRGGGDRLVEEIEAQFAKMRADSVPLEIERKYLLRALPELPPAAEQVEIEQGWLPGDKVRERLRRSQHDGGVQLFRTVKLGNGLRRIEVEEPAAPELFEALWPLTEGRRVRKRRYRVPEGDLTWEVDEFLDRDLVLAEVELPAAGAQPALPRWLRECLEREVTDDDAYSNYHLAR